MIRKKPLNLFTSCIFLCCINWGITISKHIQKTMHHNSRSDRGRKNIYSSSCIQMTSSPQFDEALFHRFSMGTPVRFREKTIHMDPKFVTKKRRKESKGLVISYTSNQLRYLHLPTHSIHGTGIITTICLIFMGILQPIAYMGLV